MKGLQQFVGMLNFYHRFVPNAAHIMRPIYDALAGKPMTLKWSDELDDAFTTAKEAPAQATMLVHPHADKHSQLMLPVQQSELSSNKTVMARTGNL